QRQNPNVTASNPPEITTPTRVHAPSKCDIKLFRHFIKQIDWRTEKVRRTAALLTYTLQNPESHPSSQIANIVQTILGYAHRRLSNRPTYGTYVLRSCV